MPIYEFFCQDCNTVFNFYSKRINTAKVPDCPKCGRKLKKMLSSFSTISKTKEGDTAEPIPGFDEARMEKALGELTRDAEKLSSEDPRDMAKLLRRFSEKTGLELKEDMQKALARLEAGEDPEQIEKEMGDVFGEEDDLPFEFRQAGKGGRKKIPIHDETLYEL